MASLRDTLANLVEQYKASDTPMANLMRGDTEGAKQAAANAFEGMTKDPYAGLNVLGTTKLVGKTAQALRHLEAQKYATKMLGLHPENTAMDRAKALNMIDDAFHGTAEDVHIIDPSKLGSATQSLSAKKALWAVDNSTTAEGYANHAAMDAKVQKLIDDSNIAERKGNFDLSETLMDQATKLEQEFMRNPNQGQNIIPLKVLKDKQAVMDAGGNTFMDVQDEMHNILNSAIENKYPTVKINNLSDEIDFSNYNPTTHYGILQPGAVRSRFAAFDPRYTGAAAIAAGTASADLLADEDKQKLIKALKQQ